MLKTPIAPDAIPPGVVAIHAVMTAKLIAEDPMTLEALDRRAHYVGPVLEGILQDMENHGQDLLDLER